METEPGTGAARDPSSGTGSGTGTGSSGIGLGQQTGPKVISNIRTRSDLEKTVVNSKNSHNVKVELLDYEEGYDDYRDEVFIIDKGAGHSDNRDNPVGSDMDSSDTSFNEGGPSTVIIKKKKVNAGVQRIDMAYNAVRAARKAASSVRPLNSAPVSTEHTGNGTLHTVGDHRSARTECWSDMKQRVSITCSFSRGTLMCGTCIGGPHGALKSVEGGPVAIMATDQSFPPCLPASNGECLRVVRVEDGSLREVTLALADCIGNGTLSTNSIILLGSLHHMSQVGTAQYCLDWVRSRWWLRERFGEDKVILPASPIPVAGFTGSSTVRTFIEVAAWVSSLGCTEALLAKDTLQHLADMHLGHTSTGALCNERLCYRLPASLDSRLFNTHVSEGWGSRPVGIPPLSHTAEEALVLPLIEMLNDSFKLGLDPLPSLERTEAGLRDIESARGVECNHLVIGGSHAGRLATALKRAGVYVDQLTTGGWKPTKAGVSALVEDMGKLTIVPDTVVIFGLDNSSFFVLGEDGTLTLPAKGPGGRYHVEGELRVASKEQAKNLIKTIKPLFAVFPGSTKVLVTPLPRYCAVPCCNDAAHLIGRGAKMTERIQGELSQMRRTIRSELYMEKVGQVRILDPAIVGEVLEANSYLDGTHLTGDWYNSLAEVVMDPQDAETDPTGPDMLAGSTRKRKASGDTGYKRGGDPRWPASGRGPRGVYGRGRPRGGNGWGRRGTW